MGLYNGKLIELPKKGRALIVTDLHGIGRLNFSSRLKIQTPSTGSTELLFKFKGKFTVFIIILKPDFNLPPDFVAPV